MSEVRIEPLTDAHFPAVVKILQDGFGSKRCCCCIPIPEQLDEFREKYRKAGPEKMTLGAVATENGEVIGYAQLSVPEINGGNDIHGIHTCKPGEMYLDQLGVSANARGKGVGTKLMNWCEEMARNRPGIDRLTLEVINGNRAKGLYERFGFVDEPLGCCECLFGCLFVCVIFGCPYGLCNPTCGVHYMVKKLT